MQELTLLSILEEKACGTREIIALLGWRPSRILKMLEKLKLEGLIESELEHGARGRPKKVYRLTELGRKYLQVRRDAERFRLRTGVRGIARTIKQTKETEILVCKKKSPYQMLWELDEVVRTIRNSAKAG
jgi:DNA-binding PadR family transcriptional regulator